MPFKRRLLSTSDQLYDTLDQRYAPSNHNHDDRYSLLNHTHTADQVQNMVGLWDQRSLVVEPMYNTCGQIYEIKQDGWLRVSMIAGQGVMLLTTPISQFSNRIPEYSSLDSGTRFTEWSIIVQHNGSYYVARRSGTVGNANNGPGESGNYWLYLPAWLPSIGVVHCTATGSADQSSVAVVIPCRAGEQYAYVAITEDDRGTAALCKGYGYHSDISNFCYLQYLPYTYSDIAVGLTVVGDRRLATDTYRYNMRLNVLSATPVLRQ